MKKKKKNHRQSTSSICNAGGGGEYYLQNLWERNGNKWATTFMFNKLMIKSKNKNQAFLYLQKKMEGTINLSRQRNQNKGRIQY